MFRFRAWLLLLTALLVACTATFVVQQYEGDPLPKERISILRINGGSAVFVVALDGEELRYSFDERGSRVHIEMLPGVHELSVGSLEDPLQRVLPLRFRAEPGKVYRVEFRGHPTSRTFHAVLWEVDPDEDRALLAVRPVSDPASPALSGPPDSSASDQPSAETAASASPEPSGVVIPGPPSSSIDAPSSSSSPAPEASSSAAIAPTTSAVSP